MNAENKRGGLVALAGLGLQAALAALSLVIWWISDSGAAWASMLLLAGGLPVWLICAILFYARHQAQVEALEMAELARQRDSTAIFEQTELRLAQRRLHRLERWFSPAVTLLLAGYYLGFGGYLLTRLLGDAPAGGAAGGLLSLAFFSFGGAFLGFLFSRYAIGMSKLPVWRLLRAGGGALTLGTLGAALLAAGFLCAHVEIAWPHAVLAYVLTAAMLVLGAEMVLNFVMDFYRPRVAGVEHRFSFDSRLANLLSEPGGVAHSIAEALNYQFGFEVSGTWFYQLLEKTFVPLLLFGLVAVVAVSGIVIVGPGQEAIILTWGKAPPVGTPTLGPGPHLKWPWPIQTADVIDGQYVRVVRVGVGSRRSEEELAAQVIKREGEPDLQLYLWRSEHGTHEELNLLVARGEEAFADNARPAETDDQPMPRRDAGEGLDRGRNQSVSLLRMVVDVHYRVHDVRKFQYGARDAEAILQALASRALIEYAASHDVDTLMSTERKRMARDLANAIHEQVGPGGLDLGVDILDVLLQGIHPPADVADAFENVVNTDRMAEGTILRAEADRIATLSDAAGSPGLAMELVAAVNERRRLERQGADPDLVAAADKRADDLLLRRVGGQAKRVVNEQLAYRWQIVNEERSRAETFSKQLQAYLAAPEVYTLHRELEVLTDVLRDARKTVLGIDPDRVELRYDAQHAKTVSGGLLSN